MNVGFPPKFCTWLVSNNKFDVDETSKMTLLSSIINYIGGTGSEADQNNHNQEGTKSQQDVNSKTNSSLANIEKRDPKNLSEALKNKDFHQSKDTVNNDLKAQMISNEITVENANSPGKENKYDDNNTDVCNFDSNSKGTLKIEETDINFNSQSSESNDRYPKHTETNLCTIDSVHVREITNGPSDNCSRSHSNDLDTSDDFYDAVSENILENSNTVQHNSPCNHIKNPVGKCSLSDSPKEEIVSGEPQTAEVDDIPKAEVVSGEPQTAEVDDILKEEVVSDEPQTAEVDDIPKEEVVSGEPQTAEVDDIPKEEVVSGEPKTTEIDDSPKEEIVSGEPQTAEVDDIHKEEVVSGEPKTTEIDDSPKEEIVSGEPQTAEVDDSPMEEIVSGEPKTAEVDDIPKEEVVSGEPQTAEVDDIPKEEVVSGEPQTAEVDDNPKEDVVSGEPQTAEVDDNPMEEIVSGEPQTAEVDDIPKEEVVSGEPKTAELNDIPMEEVVSGEPKTAVVDDILKEEVVSGEPQTAEMDSCKTLKLVTNSENSSTLSRMESNCIEILERGSKSTLENSTSAEADVDEDIEMGVDTTESTELLNLNGRIDNIIENISKESSYNEISNSNSNTDTEVTNTELSKADSSGLSTKQLPSSLLETASTSRTLNASDSKTNISEIDETSNLSTISTNGDITQKMIDEEEQYAKENEESLKNSKGKGIKDLEAAPEDQRFDRLKNLLDKSNVYAKFLLKRMDHQREDDKEKREKRSKAQEKRAATVAKKKEEKNAASSQESPGKNMPVRNKNERKRKRDDGCDSQTSSQKEATKKSSKKRKTDQDSKDEQVVPDFQEEESIKQQKQATGDHTSNINETGCRKINGEIIPERQPLLVTGGALRSYQIDGMEWLKGLFENGINGILADEMGLGKTLQCISLLAYLIERGIKGPYLIAAPLSTLPNWMSEFKKFCPKIATLLYHGSKDERIKMRTKITRMYKIDEKLKIKNYPVVITSYEIIMRDRSELCNHPWKYVIIDEGHRIKNLNCRLIRELKSYKTANRLLLTGTPLQNNLAELWSLLNFLLPDIFDDLYSFQEWFDFSAVEEDGGHEKIVAQEQEAHVLETLHAILTPFLLRRLKTDVDLSIPPKRELIVYAPLTKEQQEYYKGTLDKTILNKIKDKKTISVPVEYTNSGRPKRRTTKDVSYKSIYENDDENEDFDFDGLLEKVEAEEERRVNAVKASKSAKPVGSVVSIKMQNILMQLRKCCNHPYLLEYPLDPDTQDYRIDEDIIKVSGKMLVLDRMLAELNKRGHKVLIFSQMTSMLDIIQDFCYWRSYGFSRLDGTMKIPERQEMIEQFNNDPDVFVFLLSTRAGGLGINLSSADTCIIYDSDWNPQSDLQAQDRCHRIGQKKPVLIFRLVTTNTVDETVVERAASKRKLEKMVIRKGRFKGRQVSNKLSSQELLDLLKSKDEGQYSGMGDDNVITDECLNKLLDRSFFDSNKQSANDKTSSQPEKNEIFKVVENEKTDALF